MSIQNYNEKKAAEKKAAQEQANANTEKPAVETVGISVPKPEDVTSTAAPIPPAGTTEEVAEQMASNLSNNAEPVVEDPDWISPYSVNYAELTELLGDKELSDYVGDRLPEDEVKRIETDYKLYLKNK